MKLVKLRLISMLFVAGVLSPWFASAGEPAAEPMMSSMPPIPGVTAVEAATEIEKAQGKVQFIVLFSPTCERCNAMRTSLTDVAERAKKAGCRVEGFATSGSDETIDTYLGGASPFRRVKLTEWTKGRLNEALASVGVNIPRMAVPYFIVIGKDGKAISHGAAQAGLREAEAAMKKQGLKL
jgi:hypothetical protein